MPAIDEYLPHMRETCSTEMQSVTDVTGDAGRGESAKLTAGAVAPKPPAPIPNPPPRARMGAPGAPSVPKGLPPNPLSPPKAAAFVLEPNGVVGAAPNKPPAGAGGAGAAASAAFAVRRSVAPKAAHEALEE